MGFDLPYPDELDGEPTDDRPVIERIFCSNPATREKYYTFYEVDGPGSAWIKVYVE